MTNPLASRWRVLAELVPKLVACRLILVIGYMVARVIAKAIDKVLVRVGFDRAVERGGLSSALSGSQYEPSAIVSKIVYYGLMLFVLQMAFRVSGPTPISEPLTSLIAFLRKVLVAIVIIVIIVITAAIAQRSRADPEHPRWAVPRQPGRHNDAGQTQSAKESAACPLRIRRSQRWPALSVQVTDLSCGRSKPGPVSRSVAGSKITSTPASRAASAACC